MKKLLLAGSFVLLVTGGFAQRLVDFVNPFIGTGGHGHTYPGATLPFGMVQVGRITEQRVGTGAVDTIIPIP